jgi:hypothetical protein
MRRRDDCALPGRGRIAPEDRLPAVIAAGIFPGRAAAKRFILAPFPDHDGSACVVSP